MRFFDRLWVRTARSVRAAVMVTVASASVLADERDTRAQETAARAQDGAARAQDGAARAQDGAAPGRFDEVVRPLLEAHCLDCHDAESREAGLDLSSYESRQQVVAEYAIWETVKDRVAVGEMPPVDAGYAMTDEERQQLVGWIDAMLRAEAERAAGDPGAVLARRLSNAEYDNCIRDLTGVDIRPTSTFPVDPANEAGFDNSGESLAMSPALMQKYLEAARRVADHLVLTPEGLRFAPHPVMTDTDRDKYCVKRIVSFYERQPTAYADYFVALWDVRRKLEAADGGAEPDGDAAKLREEMLREVASRNGISPKYLGLLWEAVASRDWQTGPMAEVSKRWREIASAETRVEAERGSESLAEWIAERRRYFEPHFDNLQVNGIHNGSQGFVLWKNRQYAEHRRRPAEVQLRAAWEAELAGSEKREGDEESGGAGQAEENQAAVAAAFRESVERFCDVFPDAFYISERGRDYLGKPREQQEKGRLLSAGFHSMMGYFRDDQPLRELVLSEAEAAELDRLWDELDFIASAPQRQYQGFLWFERTDSAYMRDPVFDFARPEDQAALEEAQIAKLAEEYLAKAKRNGGEGTPIEAIERYFADINRSIRWVESAREGAEADHLRDLLSFAERAYRRPLSASQREEIQAFYRELRESGESSHEEAIRDSLVMILVSPYFSYRVDLIGDSERERALDDFELASRLSFFLWSSMPDEELLALAREGRLTEPAVLERQVARMLRDSKSRGLALEFGGNWLDFRRFEEHNSVDRERFPQFDDGLRQAMFEEPVRFLLDLLKRDGSVLELLYADHTFVNGPLGQHYGIEGASEWGDDEWRRVDEASRYHRGGVLPMAVFLTKNAPGLRTSPVKRGYWVVRRLLGERIPPPPPNVPELPNDEAALGELTLREALAKHREHESCAGCHRRFDSLGLVFESFGPVGEYREHDLGDRPVDTAAEFPDGSWRTSLDDLKDYIRDGREAEFVDNLSRKLLAFALGRSLQLSDERLVETMRERLHQDDHRFHSLIKTIVTSRPFLHKRGRLPNVLAQTEQEDRHE